MMFGTIGHARLKTGLDDTDFGSLMEDWKREVRPKVPGAFLAVNGRVAGRPDEIVFLALAQDEATYRTLAGLPEQDAFFRRMTEHFDGDVRWEDVDMEITVND